MKISKLDALEVLDSRGFPTLRVFLTISHRNKEYQGVATVPSGASRGKFEALEKRDNDRKRYFGKGQKLSVELIRRNLAKKLVGMKVQTIQAFDDRLRELDNTPQKSKLGGNVTIGLSMACARAIAAVNDMDLYKVLRAEFDQHLKPGLRMESTYSLPTPMFNIYNGGAHADNGISTQEFMVIPKGIRHFQNKVRAGAEIYQTLKQELRLKARTTGVGDEGGFAARWDNDEQVIKLIIRAIKKAGYKPGRDVYLGMDVAISQFYREHDEIYVVPNWGPQGVRGDWKPVARHYWKWLARYPIMYLEDHYHEQDWKSWSQFADEKEQRKVDFYFVGDDLTVTQYERLEKAIALKAINGMIVKPNQVGTITETFEACALAKLNDIELFVSHRSGDSCDTFAADLAVGLGAGFIKSGATARSERTEKYNRLLEIEYELR